MTDSASPMVATPDGVVTRLPLFGRESDVRAIFDLLASGSARMITLTGPGGIGKTRLAMQVAREAEPLFSDGIHFVPLASVRAPDRLPTALLQALLVRESGAESDMDVIAHAIGDRRMLLVLDNMEQIVSAGSAVSELLSRCPNLVALATSRIPLRLLGEIEYPVVSLSPPVSSRSDEVEHSPAVQLFVQRARATRADFELTPANAAAVAEITRRLDGLPLAIELAAARTKVLSPQALLTRLTHSLQVLTGGPRDAPARLQSMRDAIDWSYDLLDESHRRFFRALGVFVGGFSLDAAAAVGGAATADEALDQIATLVDHSLVVPLPEQGDEPRFGMLETIREFAFDALASSEDADGVRRRHAEWIAGWIGSAAASFFGPAETETMNRIEREAGNIRLALDWLVANNPEHAGEAIFDAWYFWGVRGHYREGLEWAGRLEPSRSRLSDRTAAKLDLVFSFLNWALGEYDVAITRFTAAREVFELNQNQRGVATALFGLGSIYRDQDRSHEAVATLRTALGIFEQLGDQAWMAFCLSVLGAVARQTMRYDEAIGLLERGLELTRSIPYPGGMSPLVDHLGDIARERGEFERALDYYRQALPFWIELQDPHGAADSLAGFAAALEGLQQPERSTRLLGAAAAAYDRLGFPRSRHSKALNDDTLDRLRTALGEVRFAEVWAEGQATSLDAAMRTALAFDATASVAAAPARDSAFPADDAALKRFGLTKREIEILQHLYEGRTNSEIGEALSISPRTAGTHIANIYGKLGVSSRAAAVATVLRARGASSA